MMTHMYFRKYLIEYAETFRTLKICTYHTKKYINSMLHIFTINTFDNEDKSFVPLHVCNLLTITLKYTTKQH